jgi:6-phosphogluconate dehydrogenase
MNTADIGVIGLAVMGQNLVLNLERNGYGVAVYNRTTQRTERFAAERAVGKRIFPTTDLSSFIAALARPRVILLMVRAGSATDATLDLLWDRLEPGDLVMDGGNAHFPDTERRAAHAATRGLHYLGVGVSGGELGALHGPSIMAGGSQSGYAHVHELLEAIAAKGPSGPCCAYLGPRSAGHYVKMVHNGIEYAMMQAIAESYDLMKRGLGLDAHTMADRFGSWNRGALAAYLVEITETILRTSDEDGTPLVERILDTASQKGTGKWSSQSALDLGAPAPTIAEAVFARVVSSLKDERVAAGEILAGPPSAIDEDPEAVLADLHDGLLMTIVIAYAQGLRQLRDASSEFDYGLDPAEAVRVWMAGCIIRSGLLEPIHAALAANPGSPSLLAVEPFAQMWAARQGGLRRTVARAVVAGLPVPAMSSTLAFVDGYRTPRLPANLLQAQRDCFGAHTYARVDREGTFHTQWEEP